MSLRVRIEKCRRRRLLGVRSSLSGKGTKPRVSVHRTLRHIYAQVIDDFSGRTLASCSSLCEGVGTGNASSVAKNVGIRLGKLASDQGVSSVLFDRGRFLYHGRVKSFAEGLRESGLKF